MSLILDALKKTQSALNSHSAKLKVTPEKSVHTAVPPKPESESQQHHIPFSFHKNHSIDFMQFLNRWTIGLCSFGLLIAVLLVGHHFFSNVFKRYAGFYGELAHAISDHALLATPVNKPIAPTTKPAPAVLPSIPHFQLDGTVQVDGKHLALINQTMYHTGQFIGDFEITQIRYEDVTLVNHKTHQIVRLTPALAS